MTAAASPDPPQSPTQGAVSAALHLPPW